MCKNQDKLLLDLSITSDDYTCVCTCICSHNTNHTRDDHEHKYNKMCYVRTTYLYCSKSTDALPTALQMKAPV